MAYNGEQLAEEQLVTTGFKEIDDFCRSNDSFYVYIDQNIGEDGYFEIEYEELVKPESMLDVLRYIDEDLAANHYVSQLKVDSVKLNPRSLAKRIANYEELLQELKGTRYEKELLS